LFVGEITEAHIKVFEIEETLSYFEGNKYIEKYKKINPFLETDEGKKKDHK
jgi:hypothetical protein